MKVYVYRCLKPNAPQGMMSVRAMEGPDNGRVIAYILPKGAYYEGQPSPGRRVRCITSLMLQQPEFKVSKAGRERVLREQQKNVHAGVVGHWMGDIPPAWLGSDEQWKQVTYNPYRYESFVNTEDQSPVYTADYVNIDPLSGVKMYINNA